jgi:hypothetical protein
MPAVGVERSVLLPFVAGEWRREGRRVSIDAQGVSMEPLIRSGDRLTIRMMAPHALASGDVVAFLRDGQIVVHRLVKKRKAGDAWRFCEKGDGLAGWNWVEEADVLGRVEVIEREGRRVHLLGFPWRLVNPAVALTWSGWIGAAELLRAVKLRLLGERPLPGCAALPARGLSWCAQAAGRLLLRLLLAGSRR